MLKNKQSLLEANPEVAKEWNYEKNGNLTPDMVAPNSDTKVWWKLNYYDNATGWHTFEWSAKISNRNAGKKCPYLTGHAVWKGFNDLETLYPEIAVQWHPTKNGDLTPDKVLAGSNQRIWWYMPYDVPDDYPIKHLRGKHFEFEWEEDVFRRTKMNRGCPYTEGRKIWTGFNDLATVDPELAKEWHPTKNGDLTPDNVTVGSSKKKVWWLYKNTNPKTGEYVEYEWEASIVNRHNNNEGCPYLSESRGEQYTRKYLENNHLGYAYEVIFANLIGTGGKPLSYDFRVNNTNILIEYQGIQHYKAIKYYGGKEKYVTQKEHDRRKREYARKNGYKLIEISYKYDTYEKVEEFLNKKLKTLLKNEAK